MHTIVVIASTLLGLAFGSFANVVIHRVPAGESVVSPPSACPRCGHEIRARHNVPVVSWLLLRGACADCGARISPRYPMVELATGALFAVIAWVVGLQWTLPLLLITAFFTVVLTAVDLETRRLPDRIVAPFAVLALGAAVLAAAMTGEWADLGRAGVGALILAALYSLAFFAYPQGMGFGDVKLAPVLGGVLGYFGWAELAVGGIAAFAWGAVVGIGTMIAVRRRRGVAIPFGPWMFLGAWTGLTVGPPIAAWYVGVTGISQALSSGA